MMATNKVEWTPVPNGSNLEWRLNGSKLQFQCDAFPKTMPPSKSGKTLSVGSSKGFQQVGTGKASAIVNVNVARSNADYTPDDDE